VSIADSLYAAAGAGTLLAAVLPRAVAGRPVSMPLVFLLAGVLAYALPLPLPSVDPVADRVETEHLAELCVIVSLMGAGLALNRPVGLRAWGPTWRLLGITMPLGVAGIALAGGLLLDWAPAAVLLLAAVLVPTDPVLAAEVRVGEPTDSEHDEDDVRFALTSEAGLNDGLAYPFVAAAIALAASAGTGWSADWIAGWLAMDVAYKCVVGVAAGLAVGRALGLMFFRARWFALRLSEHREGFVALGATFAAYGLAELLHGYGFLAVFTAACSIRSTERAHGYHLVMHEFIEQVERLLTAGLLFLAGGFVALGGLGPLTWQGAAVGLLVLLVVRPVTGLLALLGSPMGLRERLVASVFGVRGIGSLFYLAYALGAASFAVPEEEMWAVVVFTVLCSVIVHGIATSPAITRVDRWRERAGKQEPASGSGDGESPAAP
jgi:NhaP-type Na+/H+ or K+/H+ antiporter